MGLAYLSMSRRIQRSFINYVRLKIAMYGSLIDNGKGITKKSNNYILLVFSQEELDR